MAKMLSFKNKKSATGEQKFVFMSVEKPSGQASQNNQSFSEFVEYKFNTKLNVDSKFNGNLEAILKDLGDKAHEKNAALTPEKIRSNILNNLDAGKTLKDIENHLQQQNCQYASIIDGQLRFFDDAKKEISLSNLLKPLSMEIGGDDTVTGQYLEQRKKMMDDTMQALQALKGELPENSPNKIS